MTRERDIERVLDRFYADGPSEAPDRLFSRTFERINRTPQRRLVHLKTRFADMTTNAKIALAAAAALVVVGFGAVIVGRMPTTTTPPSTTPVPTVSASPTIGAVPAALRYVWAGDHRDVPGTQDAQDGSGLTIRAASAQWNRGGQEPILSSSAAMTAPDAIRFTLMNAAAPCASGDIGDYRVALNPTGEALTLTPIAEACATRQAAFAGDWTRTDCPNGASWCLGDLEAGTHRSIVFNPFVDVTAWRLQVGALSYTVPAGWANTEDCRGCYRLEKQRAPENTAIFIFDDVVAHRQGSSMCNALNEPGVGRTASELSTWLTTLPGLVSTKPAPISIGGLTGYSVDLSVAATWTQSCSFSNGQPVVSLWSDADPTDHDGFDWGIGAGAKMRVVLLDLGDGRSLLIDVEGAAADYDALLPDAMTVIDSFVFHR